MESDASAAAAARYTELLRAMRPEQRLRAALGLSRATRALIRGKPFYRLDFIEIHPSCRRGDLGAFAMGVVAARALELGATGMVLETYPETEQFYRALGATSVPRGLWKTPTGLLPLMFSTLALQTLKDATDELLIANEQEDDEGTVPPAR